MLWLHLVLLDLITHNIYIYIYIYICMYVYIYYMYVFCHLSVLEMLQLFGKGLIGFLWKYVSNSHRMRDGSTQVDNERERERERETYEKATKHETQARRGFTIDFTFYKVLIIMSLMFMADLCYIFIYIIKLFVKSPVCFRSHK